MRHVQYLWDESRSRINQDFFVYFPWFDKNLYGLLKTEFTPNKVQLRSSRAQFHFNVESLFSYLCSTFLFVSHLTGTTNLVFICA